MKTIKPCPSLPNDNGFCGGTALGCPAQQCGIDEDISPYGELCRKMQEKAKETANPVEKPKATMCPKYGKNSRGIDRCGAPSSRCNEMHSDRECRIKPVKREGEE